MFFVILFRHSDSNTTDLDDPLTLIEEPIEELVSLIKMIDTNITENDYLALNDWVLTYIDIKHPSDSMSMFILN